MAAKKKKQSGLEVLARAIGADYPSDPSAPSVIVSYLNSGTYYVSVVRYREKFGDGKYVVCNARGETLAEALRRLTETWLKRESAKDELRRMSCDDDFFYEGPR